MVDRKNYRILERTYKNNTPNTISFGFNVKYLIQRKTKKCWVDHPHIPFVDVWFTDYKTAKNSLDNMFKKNKKKDYTEKVVYSRKEKLAKLLGKRV